MLGLICPFDYISVRLSPQRAPKSNYTLAAPKVLVVATAYANQQINDFIEVPLKLFNSLQLLIHN